MKIIYACLDFVGWNKLLVFASSPRSCMQIACTWQKEKELDFNLTPCFSFVGIPGFEPGTPCSQRHISVYKGLLDI